MKLEDLTVAQKLALLQEVRQQIGPEALATEEVRQKAQKRGARTRRSPFRQSWGTVHLSPEAYLRARIAEAVRAVKPVGQVAVGVPLESGEARRRRMASQARQPGEAQNA